MQRGVSQRNGKVFDQTVPSPASQQFQSQEIKSLRRSAYDIVQRLSQEECWFANQSSLGRSAGQRQATPSQQQTPLAADLCEKIASVNVSPQPEHRQTRHRRCGEAAVPLKQQASQEPKSAAQYSSMQTQPSLSKRSSSAMPAAPAIKSEASPKEPGTTAQQQANRRPEIKQAVRRQAQQPERHSSEDSDVSMLAGSRTAAMPPHPETSSDQPRMPMPSNGEQRHPRSPTPTEQSPAPGSATKPIVLESSDEEDDVPLSLRKASMEAAAAQAAAPSTTNAEPFGQREHGAQSPAGSTLDPALSPMARLMAQRFSRSAPQGSPPLPAATCGAAPIPPAPQALSPQQRDHLSRPSAPSGATAAPQRRSASAMWRAAQVPLPQDGWEHPSQARTGDLSALQPGTHHRRGFTPRFASRLGSLSDSVPMTRQHAGTASEHAPAQRSWPATHDRPHGHQPSAGQAAAAHGLRQHAPAQPSPGNAAGTGQQQATQAGQHRSDGARPEPSWMQNMAAQANAAHSRTKASVRSGRAGQAAPARPTGAGAGPEAGHAGGKHQRAGQKRPADSPSTPPACKAARFEEAALGKEGSPMDTDEPELPGQQPEAQLHRPHQAQGIQRPPCSQAPPAPSRFQQDALNKQRGRPRQRMHLPTSFVPGRGQQGEQRSQDAGARLNILTADWAAVRSGLRSNPLRPGAAHAPDSRPAARAAQPDRSAQPRVQPQQEQQPAAGQTQSQPAQQQQHHPLAQPSASPPRPPFGFKFKPRSQPAQPANAPSVHMSSTHTHTRTRLGKRSAADTLSGRAKVHCSTAQLQQHRAASGASAGAPEASAAQAQRQQVQGGAAQHAGSGSSEEEVEVVRERPGRGSRAAPVDLSRVSPQQASSERIRQACPSRPGVMPPAAADTCADLGGEHLSRGEVEVRADRTGEDWADAQKAEWEAREAEIQRQAREAQEEKKRRKQAAEHERRAKERLEEHRREEAEKAQQSRAKELLRIRVRAELQTRVGDPKRVPPLLVLERLRIPLRAGAGNLNVQLRVTFKRAMLEWHPDRYSGSPPELQARAEEMFKLLSASVQNLPPS